MAEIYRSSYVVAGPRARGADGKVSRRVIVSTSRVDRNQRLVEQDWELAEYLANPILAYGHDLRTRFPIGRAHPELVEDEELGLHLEADLEFLPESSRFAAAVEKLWDADLLRTVSPGWVPRARVEFIYDEEGRFVHEHHARSELVEISVVPIPANPDAQRVAAGLELDLEDPSLGELFRDPDPITPPHPPEHGGLSVAAARNRLNRAALERLAR